MAQLLNQILQFGNHHDGAARWLICLMSGIMRCAVPFFRIDVYRLRKSCVIRWLFEPKSYAPNSQRGQMHKKCKQKRLQNAYKTMGQPMRPRCVTADTK